MATGSKSFSIYSIPMEADMTRPIPTPALDAGARTLVEGNTAFALDLYQQLRQAEGNLFFSPYSISTALAMTYAGARGNTEVQMADALHLDYCRRIRCIPLLLRWRRSLRDIQASGDVQLSVANALWPHIELSLSCRLLPRSGEASITAYRSPPWIIVTRKQPASRSMPGLRRRPTTRSRI